MRRIRQALSFATAVGVTLGLQTAPALARGRHHAKPVAAAKVSVKVNAAHRKALAELMSGFKFGMSKDQVLGVLRKKIDDDFQAQIRATTDITTQDKLRAQEKAELGRIASSYVEFEGQHTGWDTSIVESEFAHHTDEAMMNRWENQGGKNQRRFFFFYQGRLWKMYVQLDVSILPEDKRNFDTFKQVMEGQYGAGDLDVGLITWHAGDFDVRAVDRLKDYDALGLAIESPGVEAEVLAERKEKAPPKEGTPTIIKAIVDPNDSDHPDVKQDDGAIDAVLKANGGK